MVILVPQSDGNSTLMW